MLSRSQQHTTMAAPGPRPTVDRSIAILIAICLLATWLGIYLSWPTSFWASHDDYVYLSLAHALHLEAILHHEIVTRDGALVNHPGLPFYVASWLSLRATALFVGGKDIIAHALSDPDGFFLATRIMAGLIAAATVAGIWRLTTALGAPWRLLAILAFFAASPESVRYGLAILGNETFALPLAALLFWSLSYVAQSPPGSRKPWIILGAVAAVGYTVKLLYLDLLVASLAVAVVDSCCSGRFSRFSILGLASRVGLITITFVAVAGGLLLVFIGRRGIADLVAFHASIFTHTGLYGSGTSGLLNVEAVYRAAEELLVTPLPYLAVTAIALVLWTFVTQARSASLDRAALLWSTATITATVFAAAAVLKHYERHYVVAVSAVLPFLLVPVLAHRQLRWIAAAGIVVGLCCTAAGVTVQFRHEDRLAAAVAEDEAAIFAMPLMSTEARLWTYRVPNKDFAAAFVAGYSGVISAIAMLADPARQDFSSYSRVDRPYRYIVLDKYYFPDADAVRREKGSLEPTQSFMIRLRPQDKIHELKSVIVVERSE